MVIIAAKNKAKIITGIHIILATIMKARHKGINITPANSIGILKKTHTARQITKTINKVKSKLPVIDDVPATSTWPISPVTFKIEEFIYDTTFNPSKLSKQR